MNRTQKWFTLVEVIIIVIVVSTGIMTVVTALNSGTVYLQKSREKIIAINLAREWVEQMLNIRDTNRKKNGWIKEEVRLRQYPSSGNWFASWSYILLAGTTSGQQFFYGSGIATGFYINSGLNTNNLSYSMCQTNTGWFACPGSTPKSLEWVFFRRVRGIGLFKKNTVTQWWDFLNCQWVFGDPAECKDSSAKEYRFCVVVDYIGKNIWKVELCSVLTNFKK